MAMARAAGCLFVVALATNTLALSLPPPADIAGELALSLSPAAEVPGEFPLIRDSRSDLGWSWFHGKKVLFLGDSTAVEIFWELLFSLNGTQDEYRTKVPMNECTTESCLNICTDRAVDNISWRGFLGRCADGDRQQCRDSLPLVRQTYNMSFQLFWTGNPYICETGYGLHYDLEDYSWMNAFKDVVAKGPYDVVVFTAGAHDYFEATATADTDSNFRRALNTVLTETFAVATHKIYMLGAVGGRDAAKEVLGQPQNSGWKVIDRADYQTEMHCSTRSANSTYMGILRQNSCHRVVEAIVDIVNGATPPV